MFNFVQVQGRRPDKSGLTTGIHGVFRRLKFESDAEIGQKGTFCKGLGLSITQHAGYMDLAKGRSGSGSGVLKARCTVGSLPAFQLRCCTPAGKTISDPGPQS